MSGIEPGLIGLVVIVAIIIVIFVWVFVGVRYVSYIESFFPCSEMVLGNKKIYSQAGVLGKVMRAGSISVMLSMENICIRKGWLDSDDVSRAPAAMRNFLVGLWFVHLGLFVLLALVYFWMRAVGI